LIEAMKNLPWARLAICLLVAGVIALIISRLLPEMGYALGIVVGASAGFFLFEALYRFTPKGRTETKRRRRFE
jgi:membrane-associated phospholipid phosphatase